MRIVRQLSVVAAVIAIAPALSACQNFDLDKLDVFGLSEKKKLPGERRTVFPEGVPGVTQGVPAEYLAGNRPAEDTQQVATAPAAAADAESAEKPAATPAAPKRARATTRTPSQVRAQERQAAQPVSQQAAPAAPWPDQSPQPQPQQQQTQQAPWPTPQQSTPQSPWPAPSR